jgi:hypothetical protein
MPKMKEAVAVKLLKMGRSRGPELTEAEVDWRTDEESYISQSEKLYTQHKIVDWRDLHTKDGVLIWSGRRILRCPERHASIKCPHLGHGMFQRLQGLPSRLALGITLPLDHVLVHGTSVRGWLDGAASGNTLDFILLNSSENDRRRSGHITSLKLRRGLMIRLQELSVEDPMNTAHTRW